MDLAATAAANFRRHLLANRYPGRGLVLGRAGDDGGWLQVYWIMGRSENSRNRRLVADGSALRTEAVDPAKLSDPTQIIYEAMLELPGVHLVTNGDQTRTLAEAILRGETFEAALQTREREDDAPNYTPRISGLIDLRVRLGPPRLALSILRANDADPSLTDRTSFRPAPPPRGFGLCLTTYQGDGSPLPPFRGDPLLLPLEGDAEAVADRYWAALDAENRVALAVKPIDAGRGPGPIVLRNRHGDA